ncbi:hypothetical protein N6H14_02810 [Paenibacillus sp. CC-CFT747]|nr:hypothetical protein N6H14_02810 [Paenibacillus sp. CC-CFT747]
MEAEKAGGEAEAVLTMLVTDVQDVGRYEKDRRAFPVSVGRIREEVGRLIAEERLKLPDFDPYARLERAEKLSGELLAALQAGRMEEVRRLAEERDGLAREALDRTKRQGELRERNRADLAGLEERIRRIRQEDNGLQAELSRVRAEYDETHWRELLNRESVVEQTLSEIDRGLPSIRTETDEEHQAFEAAREKLDALLAKASSAESWLEEAGRLGRELDRTLQSLRLRKQEAWQTYNGLLEAVPSRGLSLASSSGLGGLAGQLAAWNSRSEGALASAPYNLAEADRQVSGLTEAVRSFAELANRLASQKEAAERALLEADARYRSVQGPFGSSSYGRSYASMRQQARQLLEAGAYEEAYRQGSELLQLVAALELQNRPAASPAGFGYPRSRGGGGYSGGGSWGQGSSGRSSGGGNWGGGSSGNQSGGSKW